MLFTFKWKLPPKRSPGNRLSLSFFPFLLSSPVSICVISTLNIVYLCSLSLFTYYIWMESHHAKATSKRSRAGSFRPRPSVSLPIDVVELRVVGTIRSAPPPPPRCFGDTTWQQELHILSDGVFKQTERRWTPNRARWTKSRSSNEACCGGMEYYESRVVRLLEVLDIFFSF